MRIHACAASVIITALALSIGGTAAAQARLSAATPSANATASGVRALTLTFAEAINEQLSGVDIVMTAMPGMSHHKPMKISGFKTALGADRKTLTMALPRALPAGTYKVTWRAVSADGRRAEGSYGFSAK
ncbi:copper resistance protein CopC [Sphingobium sp. SCG-1]|uniref:copper homeostasis periplasmic binding protein CopC n=1 Tax=Sphingobium sp. SCG-1 TaxID=2072936 RepID=UPI000CD6B529|nr:copper homeostasis periplasmic binding protein CopC [Sphingobium sp. SCG-1]AUW59777.1 copper resistance protein CopC [Sphingobium sp. SCG-1]